MGILYVNMIKIIVNVIFFLWEVVIERSYIKRYEKGVIIKLILIIK